MTPYEADSYESGGRRFEKIVRFATVDCVKAGRLIKDKGIWSVTDEGRDAYEMLPDGEAFYRRACKLYAEWEAAQSNVEVSATVTGSEQHEATDKAVSVTYEVAEEQA